jgi:hypothetical protein
LSASAKGSGKKKGSGVRSSRNKSRLATEDVALAVQVVFYDPQNVEVDCTRDKLIDAALDPLLKMVNEALSDEYLEESAKEENLPIADIRADLERATTAFLKEARALLELAVEKEYPRLVSDAVRETIHALTAIVIRQMPDMFGPEFRRSTLDDLDKSRTRRRIQRLTTGRPRTKIAPDMQRAFVRLVAVGERLFSAARKPLDAQLARVIGAAIAVEPLNDDEKDAASRTLSDACRAAIRQADHEPKKLALYFAARVVGLDGNVRTLQRRYRDSLAATQRQ